MTASYPSRTWLVRDLPLSALDALPLRDSSIPHRNIVSMVSSVAEDLERRGQGNVFYYDAEQEVAGLDEVYGLVSLKAAARAFSLPDGTRLAEGALVFTVTRIDFEAGTRTTLFEQL